MHNPYIKSFLILLNNYRDKLTPQQYSTLRGQTIKGDVFGAQKGLGKILHDGQIANYKKEYTKRVIYDPQVLFINGVACSASTISIQAQREAMVHQRSV